MGSGLFSIPLWVILLLPFAKIVTTGFSIGSGGSGGIFGPGMVIGGMLGAAVWRLSYHILPGLPDTAAPFVIVGMMALVGKDTIYTSQVETRADSPAHRLQLSVPLLSTLSVSQAMAATACSLSPGQSIAEAEQKLAELTLSGAPVLDQNGFLQGVLTQRDIQKMPPLEREHRTVAEFMTTQMLLAYPEETLDDTLEHLTTQHISWMPVVDSEAALGKQRVLGLLTVGDIIHAYRRALTKDLRRTRGLVKGTVMLETKIEPAMPLVGHPLREAHLPDDCLVVSLRREGELIFPRGSTIILPGDMVTFLVNPQGEAQLQDYLGSTDQLPNQPISAD